MQNKPTNPAWLVAFRERLRAWQEATSWLRSRIANHVVSCATDAKDRYGRWIATCYLDGTNINAEIVAAGWAWAYRRYSTRYIPEEDSAKSAQKGVWKGTCIPPWEHRHKKK